MSTPHEIIANELVELLRLPTGDRLSLRAWYEAAQRVVKHARDAGVDFPPEIHAWLAGAEARAKDPAKAALENAVLAQFLGQLRSR